MKGDSKHSNQNSFTSLLQHDELLLSSRTSLLLFEYMSEEAKANSFIRPIEIANQLASFGLGTSIESIMPSIETYTGVEKYTNNPVFVKIFQGFKSARIEVQTVVMNMIDKTLNLQEENRSCIVRVIKYNLAKNNLYVFTEQCEMSLRSLLKKQRALKNFSQS